MAGKLRRRQNPTAMKWARLPGRPPIPVEVTIDAYNRPYRWFYPRNGGRTYKAARFAAGEVELYVIEGRSERFLRYAEPDGARVDRFAIRVLEAVLHRDP